jgi:hypothetical protein
MDFLSIIAEAKGEKAPVKKATLKFKTAPAPKHKTAKATSTASLASKGAKLSYQTLLSCRQRAHPLFAEACAKARDYEAYIDCVTSV